MEAKFQKKKLTLIKKKYKFDNLIVKFHLIKSFTIKKPPDEIIVNEKLKASNVLKFIIL